jgi:hypothetical protein
MVVVMVLVNAVVPSVPRVEQMSLRHSDLHSGKLLRRTAIVEVQTTPHRQ